ncbi:MAG: ribosome small subunit-dependent GTPase A [Acidimicrobiales bacterium]|nr:ribosome small subunit-dependent GTPase A [Acidimicrobiales bacterium]
MSSSAPFPSSAAANHSLVDYGWGPRWEAQAAGADPELVAARVLRHDGHAVLVGLDGDVDHVHIRASTPPLAVGDWVLVDPNGPVVEALLPRQSLLQRRDPSTGKAQPMAANIDLVGVVNGLDRPIKVGRIQRFVTQTWDAGALPLIVLTKSDVMSGDERDAVVDELRTGAPGADVVVTGAVTGDGLDELRDALRDRTVAFVGESGAGKSTLLNALAGRDLAATGAVRDGDHKGRHTTTARELHVLDGDIRVIDTPGLREVGLWTDAQTVDAVFDDVLALADGCHFADCLHDAEPGCAVRAAVDDGALPAERLDAWHKLRREAEAAELRADPAAARRAGKRFGRMVKEAKRMKPSR